jgi:RNA polymerase sigma-70 factor (ECF subfamily)
MEQQAILQRYAELFNNRNWGELDTLLLEEAQIEIVSRLLQAGALSAGYYDSYAQITKTDDIRAEPGLVDGVPAIAIFRPDSSDSPAYFVLIESRDGRISRIRDFRYAPYIAVDARFSRGFDVHHAREDKFDGGISP